MIQSKLRVLDDNPNTFIEILEKDLSELKDGYIYAFLIDDNSFGINCNYIRLKNISTNSEILFQEPNSKEIISWKAFSRKNIRFPVGYCVSEKDAETIRLLRVKFVIDEFCDQLGFDGLKHFVDEFSNHKEMYPEKMI